MNMSSSVHVKMYDLVRMLTFEMEMKMILNDLMMSWNALYLQMKNKEKMPFLI